MMPPSSAVIATLKSEFDRSGEDDIKNFKKIVNFNKPQIILSLNII